MSDKQIRQVGAARDSIIAAIDDELRDHFGGGFEGERSDSSQQIRLPCRTSLGAH